MCVHVCMKAFVSVTHTSEWRVSNNSHTGGWHALMIRTFACYSCNVYHVKALGVDFVIKRATEENLMLTSAIIMGVAQMTMIYGEHTVAMYCSLTVIAMASSVLKVCQQSLISQAAGRQRCGEVLGVADSVSSLSEVGVPMVIGVLMQHVSPFAPSVVAGVLGVGAGVGWLVAKPRVLAQKRE
eukprot:m.221174 g.221174  ORF g.221174 m.221174 type:complete len:183 (-) comp19181_c1_seq1:99-647(-)